VIESRKPETDRAYNAIFSAENAKYLLSPYIFAFAEKTGFNFLLLHIHLGKCRFAVKSMAFLLPMIFKALSPRFWPKPPPGIRRGAALYHPFFSITSN